MAHVFSRVKGERGRVQVRRRPTVSALSGPVSVRRVDHHASLAPPHRTGRAVFPHPALGRVSHPGMRRRLTMTAPELTHSQPPEHHVCVVALCPARRDLVPLPAWPWCTAPLGAAGALVELLGSRQSPTPWPVETHPEPGRLPSPPVLLSDRSKRYYAPLRRPPPPPRPCSVEGRDPSQSWASRVAPCSVSTCHAPYPGERSRGHRSVAPA